MTRAELLIEARAWREIAERCAGLAGHVFLCWFLKEAYVRLEFYRADLSEAVRGSALARVHRHAAGTVGLFSDTGEIGDPITCRERRVTAALLLELECRDEARALTPKRARSAKRRRSPTQRAE